MKKHIITACILSSAVGAALAAPNNPHNYVRGELYQLRPTQTVGKFGENYDVSKIDIYKKLDILDKIDGSGRITSAQDWRRQRPQVMDFVCRKFYTPTSRTAAFTAGD